MRGRFGLLGLVAWASCVLVVHADAEGSDDAINGSAALGGVLIGVATVNSGCAWMFAGLASAGLLTASALSQDQTLREEAALKAVGLMAVGGLFAGWIGGALADGRSVTSAGPSGTSNSGRGEVRTTSSSGPDIPGSDH